MSLLQELHSAHTARVERLSRGRPSQRVVEVECDQKAEPAPIVHEPVFGGAPALSSGTPADSAVTVSRVMREVAVEFDVCMADLAGHKRTRRYVTPRHIAMYLVRRLTGLSLPMIGRRMGGYDHTSVIHGVRHGERLAANVEHAVKVRAVISRLEARA